MFVLVKSHEGSDSVLCCGLALQALAQELSGFVSSVKVRMAEEGTMTALASVMRLCTQSASRRRQVRQCQTLHTSDRPHYAEVTDLFDSKN